jgi:hypothetical protein
VSLSTGDSEVADAARAVLPPAYTIRRSRARKYDYFIVWRRVQRGIPRAERSPFNNALPALGLWSKTTAAKFVPDVYEFNAPAVRLTVRQDLLDTDGTVDRCGNIAFYSVSPQLAQDVRFLVQSFGGAAKVHQAAHLPPPGRRAACWGSDAARSKACVERPVHDSIRCVRLNSR